MNLDKTSIIDLKLGTSTVTLNCQNQGNMEKRIDKDKSSTSFEHGFKIVGYKLITDDGVENYKKRPFLTYQQSKDVISKLIDA